MILWWIFFFIFKTVYTVDKTEIYLYFYDRSSIDTYIYKTTLNDDVCSRFNTSKESVIFVHGWKNIANLDTNNGTVAIKVPVLSSHDVYFIAVDYPYYTLYTTAVKNQPEIGKLLGNFLNEFSKNCSYSLTNVRMIGHSLGAHIAGVAGRTTGSKIPSIIGLDPAGPEFFPSTYRLHSTDATFVQVEHTNAGGFGISFSIGDSDYWVNGGYFQPSCLGSTDVYCSHALAMPYYGASVSNPKAYLGYKCTAGQYVLGVCKNSSTGSSYMGGYIPDTTASGDYYV